MKRILAGPHAVTEAVKSTPDNIAMVCIAEGLRPNEAKRIEELAQKGRVAVEHISKQALEEMAPSLNTQGVIAITGGYPYVDLDALVSSASKRTAPLLIALDQIQDPQNLGAILRSAYAFGACGAILTRHQAAAITPATVRTSAGASELIKVARVTNLVRTLDELRDLGYRVLGAAGESATPIAKLDWGQKTVLVMGNEGKGLRRLTREHCDEVFSIPMAAQFDSLNVSAAAAISLFEASRHRDHSRNQH